MGIGIAEARNLLSEILNRAAFGGERIIITSRGKPKAAVISIKDLELLEELEDAHAARVALQEYERGETLPWEQVRAELLGIDDVSS